MDILYDRNYYSEIILSENERIYDSIRAYDSMLGNPADRGYR